VSHGKLIPKNILFILLLAVSFYSRGQLVDGDTTRVINAPLEEEIHSPRKATLYSAVLPGLGQAYNKKYWKIPVIYIGLGAFVYFIDWNNDNYKFSRTAYQHLTDDNPDTRDYELIEAVKYYDLENTTSFNNFKEGLTRQQDYYRRNRDLLVITMIGFYGLNIIDASVDAHLFNFDISDDLTFNWNPSITHLNNQYIYCFNCSLSF